MCLDALPREELERRVRWMNLCKQRVSTLDQIVDCARAVTKVGPEGWDGTMSDLIDALCLLDRTDKEISNFIGGTP